jgi:hypothetical protein
MAERGVDEDLVTGDYGCVLVDVCGSYLFSLVSGFYRLKPF